MTNDERIIRHLEGAIAAHERGIALFGGTDFQAIPAEREKEISSCCEECAGHFKVLREELDLAYRTVYEAFRDGGDETDCRIGKNRWCFGLVEFARCRLRDLKGRATAGSA
jgi:hypothetical protein